MKIWVAYYLNRWTHDPEALPALLEGLGVDEERVRSDTVTLLSDFPKKQVLEGLVKCLHDPAYTVRVGAMDSLLGLLELGNYDAPFKGSLFVKTFRLYSPLESVWMPAADFLSTVINQKIAGKSDEEAGLFVQDTPKSPEVLAFIQSYANEQGVPPKVKTFPLEALLKMSPEEREWASVVLLDIMVEKHDPRAVIALTDMNSALAAKAFQDYAGQEVSNAFGVELARGLWLLSRDAGGLEVLVQVSKRGNKKDKARALEVIAELKAAGAPL